MNGNAGASHDTTLVSSMTAADDSTPRTFINSNDFLRRLAEFCLEPSELGLNSIQTTLDQYQEASHLLEPHLASLSEPALQAFKSHLLQDPALPSTSDGRNSVRSQAIAYLARYLYWLSKVVGDKILVTYFLHHPEDLDLLLKLTASDTFAADETPWEYRYVLILWLSLVVSIPFALNKFGAETQDVVENKIVKIWLRAPGKERDAATLLASKYYTRRDVQETGRLQGFLEWARSHLQGEETAGEEVDIFLATGILQTLCRITKSTTQQAFETQEGRSLLGELYAFCALYDPNVGHSAAGACKSPLLRQLRAKFEGRLAGAYLPVPRQRVRAVQRGLLGGPVTDLLPDSTEDDFDVPAEVEALVSDLLELLPDSDSRVRWSTSKALARISSSLPLSYVDQIVSAIADMYSTNVIIQGGAHAASGSQSMGMDDGPTMDLSLVSSATWNGCNLCLASFLRSSLLNRPQVAAILPWLLRSLTFTQRKGAQKLGTNVRDSACYLIWALARAFSGGSEALVSQDGIERIARLLVVVACTDEEVSVRRAASAAFQECVGRLSSVPAGLDVLLLLDSYIVGSRRQAFQLAAPGIATRHPFYASALVHGLATRSLFHADAVMRELAAQSLGKILKGDKDRLSAVLKENIGAMAQHKEQAKVHGTLLFLAEVVTASEDARLQAMIFESLASIPSAALTGSSVPLLLPVIARVIAATLDSTNAIEESAVAHKNTWRRFVDLAAKRPESSAHDAAAQIYEATSARFDCLNDLKNCLRTLKNSTSFISQQYVTRVLGFFDYSPSSTCHALLDIVIDRLCKVLDPKNLPTYKTIEAKRNALDSLGRICRLYLEDQKTDKGMILSAIFAGMSDYTTDERGDVGSWVRMICMERLTDILLEEQRSAGSVDNEVFDRLVGLLLTNSAERLDNVREVAGLQLGRLAHLKGILADITLSSWRQYSVALPHLLSLLGNGSYTRPILSGLAISIGSPHNATQSRADAFVRWVSELPVNAPEKAYDSARLLSDLVALANEPHQNNRRLVPILQTLALLLEDQVWYTAAENSAREELEAVGRLAIANLRKSKVAARLLASARILLVLTSSASWFPDAPPALLELYEQGDGRMKESIVELETWRLERTTHTRLFPPPPSGDTIGSAL